MKNLVLKNKNFVIVLIFGNLIGLLNLLSAFFMRQIRENFEFNLYMAFASILVILAMSGRLLQKVFNVYGMDLYCYLLKFLSKKNGKVFFSGAFFLVLILYFCFVYLGIGSYGYMVPIFISVSMFLFIFSSVYSGVLLHQKQFLNVYTILGLEGFLNLVFGLILYYYLGNLGYWFVYIAVSLIVFLIFQNRFYQLSRENVLLKKFEIGDLITNFFLLGILEVVIYLDGILAFQNLSPEDAYIFNSLSLVRKVLFFSILGFTQIILSDVRLEKLNSLVSTIKSMSITLIISGVLLTFTVFPKDLILTTLGLGEIQNAIYLKFMLSSILFAVVLILTTSFSSVKSFAKRTMILLSIAAFIVIYAIFFTSIESGLNIFNAGLGVILILEMVLLFSETKSKEGKRLFFFK